MREKGTLANAPRLRHADALAQSLKLEMRAWFTPSAANYFGRINRPLILEALTEAGRPARTRSWSKLKKAELAALAEREITGTGWLPEPLRRTADTVQRDAEHPGMPPAAAA